MMSTDAPSLSRFPNHSRHSPQASSDASDPEHSFSIPANARPTMQPNFHPRDASLPRGRPTIANAASYANTGKEGRASSAQRPGVETGSLNRDPGPIETTLRRQNSSGYVHHRQTSVIHGVQHSRNPSFNSPSTSSPLSPESPTPCFHHSPSQCRQQKTTTWCNRLCPVLQQPYIRHSRGTSRTFH